VGDIERWIERQRPKDPAFALALASWLDRLLILYADHIVRTDLLTPAAEEAARGGRAGERRAEASG
jgi:hypothetical protein